VCVSGALDKNVCSFFAVICAHRSKFTRCPSEEVGRWGGGERETEAREREKTQDGGRGGVAGVDRYM